MYLSKLELDLRNASVRQGLRDFEDMHRTIQKMFGTSRTEANVLYRLVPKENTFFLYLHSAKEPSIDEKNGMKLIGCRELNLLEMIEEGKQFSFSLLAYPSKKVKKEGSKNSRRFFIIDRDEQLMWLQRKAEQSGFRILMVSCNEKEPVYFYKNGHKFCLKQVEFMGKLVIEDAKLFMELYKKGIGPEKAYGMGMLLLI